MQYQFEKDNVCIEAVTLHAFMMRACGIDWSPDLNRDFYETELPVAFMAAEDVPVYDLVIIDEGQDLLTDTYLECIDRIVQDGLGDGTWAIYYDPNQNIFNSYAEFLKRYRPRYFVFENVLGLLSAKDEDGTLHFDNMRALFRECGYSTEFRPLNASDYGVLQNRKRIILIGVRGEHEDFYPEIPVVQNRYLVNEVFGDLPAIAAGGGTTEPVPTAHYDGEYLYESGIKEYDTEPVTFHQARPHTEQDLEIYRIVVDTWNRTGTRVSYVDLPENLRTHQNTASFLDRFKVVAGNLPYAQTIVAHIARDGHYFIHPDIEQNRSITPREAARIQTFPDNYCFESKKGTPSRTLAFKQIGNAVPVCLAYHIALSLLARFADQN